jgi:hypothetical protein
VEPVRETLLAALVASLVVVSATPAASLPTDGADDRTWLAGDWHVHTNASHDACAAHNVPGLLSDPSDGCGDGPHTLSADGATRMRQAEARGLDYLRITDHNTLGGPLHAQANYEGPVTLVPGYEHSLPDAHAGVSSLTLLDRGIFEDPSEASAIDPWIDAVQGEPGGHVTANHPFSGGSSAWTEGHSDPAAWDAIEIWNIHWLWRDEVTNGFTDASNNGETLDLWTQLLNQGHELPIVGASDNHWLATTAVQGPGQPTTWVKATADTPSAILEAAREGRTYVTWDPVGPRVALTAEGPSGEAIVGDHVPTGEEVTFRAEVTAGAGERIRFVSCNGLEHESPPGAPVAEVTLTFAEDCWMRVDLVTVDDLGGSGPDDLVYRAITSPVYVG